MKKLLYFLTSAIVAMGIMMGCSKPDDITPDAGGNGGNNEGGGNSSNNTASWGITVYDKTTSSNVEGAKVCLYDADNDNNISLLTTDAKGYVCFANLQANKKYYIAVVYGEGTYSAKEGKALSAGFNKLTFYIETTAIVVTVKDNSSGSTVSNATVKVYESSADRKNKTNSLLTKATGSNGVLTITGTQTSKTYYLYATDGTKSAYSSKLCSSGSNTLTMKLTSGDLKFVNSKSDPYIFTATNNTTGTVYKTTVSANSNKTLSNCETGSYTVSYEQASGYWIYATTGSWDAATLDDGHIRTYTLR